MWPVYTLFLLLRGLSFTQIGITGTATALAAIIGEIPTGYVGDRIGRRNSLIISQLLFASVPAGLVISHSFPAFLLVFSLLGIAETFQTGSGDAWLYDTLDDKEKTELFTHIRGRGGAIRKWVGAGTMIAGGVLYTVEPTYPFIAATILSTFGAVVLVTLPKSSNYASDEDTAAFRTVDAFVAVRKQLSQPPLRSFVIYISLLFAVIRASEEFIQPITANAIDGYLTSNVFFGYMLPEEVALGVMYAAFTVVSAVASDYASNARQLLGLRRVVLAVPIVTSLLMLFPIIVPVFVVPVFFVMQSAKSLMRPITNQYINDNAQSFGRATVLSAVSMVYALMTIPFMLLGGVAADTWEPVVAVTAIGVLFLAAAALSYVWESPISKSTTDTSVDKSTN
ncbi:MFS transporter [Haladaptatus cibarius]|uniref:MFS transporter n=1 Tax=Haladaptatus cibarius TaxID=453847 RepID=UPI00130E47A8|nr:MFS transporter [Haladaptatus cibarius]